MKPRIETLIKKILIGKRIAMTFSENKTFDLWHGFMPRRKEIKNNIGTDLYSIKVYEPSYFTSFNPAKEFDNWAAVEVKDFDIVPEEMETIILKEGLYAVFNYKGLSTDGSIFQYIYSTWLPNSDYLLDDRPHFEVLGDKYKNNDPNSEEEIWVPIKRKDFMNSSY
ncbi:MAG: GyrI-like domain-containing protein [Bacteroidota bacterium]